MSHEEITMAESRGSRRAEARLGTNIEAADHRLVGMGRSRFWQREVACDLPRIARKTSHSRHGGGSERYACIDAGARPPLG